MTDAFTAYRHLWPEIEHYKIKGLLSKLTCFHYPEDLASAKIKDLNKKTTLVLYKEKNKNIVSFIVSGFEHILCVQREDLKQELLAAALMVQKSDRFVDNLGAYFFNQFDPDSSLVPKPNSNLTVSFQSTTQKDDVFKLFKEFWGQKSSMEALEDVCLQIADELFTNVFFNAPILKDGKRPFKEVARDSHITLPANLKPRMFTCFSENKVIVGCEDPFGSLVREPIMYRLESLYTEAMTGPRNHTAGSGLGFKFLIDNSSNFYVFSEKGRKTVFACGLILKGLKANVVANKNIHFVV